MRTVLRPRRLDVKIGKDDPEVAFELTNQVIENEVVSAASRALARTLGLLLVLVLIIVPRGAAPEPV